MLKLKHGIAKFQMVGHSQKVIHNLEATSRPELPVSVLFNNKGLVHHEHTPPGQTITKEYYTEIIHMLKNARGRNRSNCRQVVTGTFVVTMHLHTLCT